MFKPLWAITGVALLGIAGIGGAIVAVWSRGDEEVVQQPTTDTPSSQAVLTPGPGVTLWRWMEVTVLIPDDSGIRASPATIYYDDQGSRSRPGFALHKVDPVSSNPGSYAAIDAENGEILRREVRPEDHETFERILGSVSVGTFDPATAPWPYNGDPPAPLTDEVPSIRPHPATGMYSSVTTGSGGYRGTPPPRAECEIVFSGITVRNDRSSAFVGRDPETGAICKNLSLVQPEDVDAFNRFLDRVALCEYEGAQC